MERYSRGLQEARKEAEMEKMKQAYGMLSGQAWWNSKKNVPCVSLKASHWKDLQWAQLKWGGYIYRNQNHAHWVLMGPPAIQLAARLRDVVDDEQRHYIDQMLNKAKAEGLDVPDLG